MDDFTWSDPPTQTAFPVARAGYPIILACAFITAVLALLEMTVPALLALLITVFVVYFFRDPDRPVPSTSGVLVAPADGKVVQVESVAPNPYYDGECQKIGIFMSVFNVHVNRMPCDARVDRIRYWPGKFVAANLDKASLDNERNAIYLKAEDGRKITVVQIAGLVARRILCNIGEGNPVRRGQRFGMICFGSRVDLYLPLDTEIRVQTGDRVKAGSTIVGVLS